MYKAEDYLALLKLRKSPKRWKRQLLVALSAVHRGPPASQARGYRRPHNHRRNRGFALEEFDKLPPYVFERMFRMDRTSFEDLEELVTPHLERDSSMAERSSGSPIPVRTRLAATLRWLAGGSYIDICFAWGLAHSTFYSDRGVLWPTIEAIDAIFDIGVPIDNPDALFL